MIITSKTERKIVIEMTIDECNRLENAIAKAEHWNETTYALSVDNDKEYLYLNDLRLKLMKQRCSEP